jgi:DNA end-binding protein Ku
MASTVWRGYISFGLISIPVRLYRAARAERVSFRRLYRQPSAAENDSEDIPEAESFGRQSSSQEPVGRPSVSEKLTNRAEPAHALEEAGRSESTLASQRMEPFLAPVQQVSVEKGSDEVLPAASVVKGYEYDKGRFVVVEPEELKSLAPKTSASMEIQEFVRFTEIDPVYLETSYYVTPEEAGEKAYALLYRSLQTTGLVALAQFAMHNREHVVVVRPGGSGLLAHTMFYESEVRADEEYRTDVSVVADKELKLAETLIHSLAAPFDPAKYRDNYRERLESMLAQKVRGQPVAAPVTVPKQAEVVDIADALRRSLANLKKPAVSEKQPAKSAPRAKKARGTS